MGVETPFQIIEDGMNVMGKCIYLPKYKTLKNEILKETHELRFVVHLRSTKMYKDLKEFYWWLNMKRKIAEHVTKYNICQYIKVEHQSQHGHYSHY